MEMPAKGRRCRSVGPKRGDTSMKPKPKAKRRRATQSRQRAKARPSAIPAPQPDLNVENPAVFDESPRGIGANESVEDPLRDWPENANDGTPT